MTHPGASPCGSVRAVEAIYLTALVVTLLAIGALSVFVVVKLFAGQR